MSKENKIKAWPKDCKWPEPGYSDNCWEAEDAENLPIDDECQDLLDIKEYMDRLVKEGRLNDDYSLNEDFDEGSSDEFEPETGSDYWDDGFEYELWSDDVIEHLDLIKLSAKSPAGKIQQTIGYEFINENLLRQAFTRRSFGVEYGVADNEKLEFIGDAVIQQIVTRVISDQLTSNDVLHVEGPFVSNYSEGDLSKLRTLYVSKEYLSKRAVELGLDEFILYGSGDSMSSGSLEDMIEAILGAVAIDCNWDRNVLETVADRLLCIQITNPDVFLRATYFDIFNSWHQKHFKKMPEYEMSASDWKCFCTLRFQVPDNQMGIRTTQRIDVVGRSRSDTREEAAFKACCFVRNKGLWLNLADADIVPSSEDSINQLQELFQKKYVEEPAYSFECLSGDIWLCNCVCGGVDGQGRGQSKTTAKKKAAFAVLVRLLSSAGICKPEWKEQMYRNLLEGSAEI